MTLRLIFQDWIWSRYSNVEFENDEKVLDECWQWIGQAEPTNQGESQKHREDQSIQGGTVLFSGNRNIERINLKLENRSKNITVNKERYHSLGNRDRNYWEDESVYADKVTSLGPSLKHLYLIVYNIYFRERIKVYQWKYFSLGNRNRETEIRDV